MKNKYIYLFLFTFITLISLSVISAEDTDIDTFTEGDSTQYHESNVEEIDSTVIENNENTVDTVSGEKFTVDNSFKFQEKLSTLNQINDSKEYEIEILSDEIDFYGFDWNNPNVNLTISSSKDNPVKVYSFSTLSIANNSIVNINNVNLYKQESYTSIIENNGILNIKNCKVLDESFSDFAESKDISPLIINHNILNIDDSILGLNDGYAIVHNDYETILNNITVTDTEASLFYNEGKFIINNSDFMYNFNGTIITSSKGIHGNPELLVNNSRFSITSGIMGVNDVIMNSEFIETNASFESENLRLINNSFKYNANLNVEENDLNYVYIKATNLEAIGNIFLDNIYLENKIIGNTIILEDNNFTNDNHFFSRSKHAGISDYTAFDEDYENYTNISLIGHVTQNNNALENITFKYKEAVNIKISDIKSRVGEKVVLEAILTDTEGNLIDGGNIVFKINGVSLKSDNTFNSNVSALKLHVSNGTVSTIIVADKMLRNAKNVTVSYSGTSIYEETKVTQIAEIALRYAQLNLTTLPIIQKHYETITFRSIITDVTNNNNTFTPVDNDKAYVYYKINNVTLKENGIPIYVPVVKGVAEYNFTVPPGMAGITNDYALRNYSVTAGYVNPDYYPTARDTSSFNIERSNITIDVDEIIFSSINNNLVFNIKIKDYKDFYLVGNNKINLKVNGVTLKDNNNKTLFFVANDGLLNINITLPYSIKKVKDVEIVTGERSAYLGGRLIVSDITVI